jgi:hypothetical protein
MRGKRGVENNVETAMKLTRDLALCLRGHTSLVRECALAEITAMWLASMPTIGRDTQEEALKRHVEFIRKLIPTYEAVLAAAQRGDKQPS